MVNVGSPFYVVVAVLTTRFCPGVEHCPVGVSGPIWELFGIARPGPSSLAIPWQPLFDRPVFQFFTFLLKKI